MAPGPPDPADQADLPATGADLFVRAEHDVRAMVAAPWWAVADVGSRQRALGERVLRLPDGSRWVFGAWARWYRAFPAEPRWFPCPPPLSACTRASARAEPPGTPPPVPPALLPTGPDYTYDFGIPPAVAGTPVSGALLYRLRSVVAEAAAAPEREHPLGWSRFLHGTPGTVAATWATMLWCAAVPVFDSGAAPDGEPAERCHLLRLWEPYLAPGTAGGPAHGGAVPAPVRLTWPVPVSLREIIGLYTERLRAGAFEAAGRILRSVLMTAQALRDDPRFRWKATALLSMLEPLMSGPVDHWALPYGDHAVEQEWIKRCPAPLALTLCGDTAPGERFQLAFYDLATALGPLCPAPGGDGPAPEGNDPRSGAHGLLPEGSGPGPLEPRQLAVALLAADIAAYRPDLTEPVGAWLDPELRGLLRSAVGGPRDPVRGLWPSEGRLPAALRPVEPATARALLGATAAAGLAWCRLAKDLPIPPDGLTVPEAFATALAERSTPETGRPGGARPDPEIGTGPPGPHCAEDERSRAGADRHSPPFCT